LDVRAVTEQVAVAGRPECPLRSSYCLAGAAVQRLAAGPVGHCGPAEAAAPEPELRRPPEVEVRTPRSPLTLYPRKTHPDAHAATRPPQANPCWPRSASVTTLNICIALSPLYTRFFWA